MSTRATYTIENKNYHDEIKPVTFYIHHDGYPQGAADYFFNMVVSDHNDGGFVEKFLSSNKRASITDDGNSHGDTEFHYHLKADGRLTVHTRIDYSDVWKEKEYWLDEFINEFVYVTDETPITYMVPNHSRVKQYLTAAQLYNKAMESFEYCSKHHKWEGNCKGTLNDANRYFTLIDIAYSAGDKFKDCSILSLSKISTKLVINVLDMMQTKDDMSNVTEQSQKVVTDALKGLIGEKIEGVR